MLETVFYQNGQDLIFKVNLATHVKLWVTPSPHEADALRKSNPHINVVTISKWTTDHLRDSGSKKIRKSILMIKLISLWKNYFPKGKTSEFQKAFDLFTELRSFTLDLNLIHDILSETDKDMVRSVLIFWTYLQELERDQKIIDEQSAYFKIGQGLTVNQSLAFVGFRHMSAIQIDMLKSLSQRICVELYFPKEVYLNSFDTDWIKWIEAGKAEVSYPLGSTSGLERKIYLFPEGHAGLVVKYLNKTVNKFDLVFAVQELDYLTCQDVVLEDSYFKIPQNIFIGQWKVLLEELHEMHHRNGELEVKDIQAWLKSESQKIVENKKYLGQKYLRLKSIDVFFEVLEQFSEFNSLIDKCSLEVLEKAGELNLPRTFIAPLNHEFSNELLNLKDVILRRFERPAILLATKNMGTLKLPERKLEESIVKKLLPLGPVKRNGLEFLFLKYEITEMLKDSNNILAIEESLLTSDPSWREFLKDVEVRYGVVDYGPMLNRNFKKNLLVNKDKDKIKLEKNNSRLSASRLQSYLDCPQKYYYQYICPTETIPDERSFLTPLDLGLISHQVMHQYFAYHKQEGRELNDYNEELHQGIVEENMQKYLSERKITLSFANRVQSLGEIQVDSCNGINFLLDFLKANPGTILDFEVPLPKNKWEIKGAIDCLLRTADGKMLVLDFKRSESSIGSRVETISFQKLQVWIYLTVLLQSNHELKLKGFGYLNLGSGIEKSLLFFEENFNKDFASDFNLMLGLFHEKLQKLIEKFKQDSSYLPSPRSEKICSYCNVKLFCFRGVQ